MLPPEDLYTFVDDPSLRTPDQVPAQPVLVHAFDGFVDAGSAAALATRHLLQNLPNRVVVRFDVDQLVDYRSSRPRMTFASDHFAKVSMPELVVHEVRLPDSSVLLLLVGPEPDTQWERFVAAVGQLVTALDVRVTVGLQGVPWAAPHTRPIGVTAHASRRDLIAGRPRWLSEVDVPGHIGALLELRLAEAGHDSMGFTAHVPHYLATTEFPPAAVTLLDALSDSVGVELPTQELRDAGSEVLAQVDDQIADSPETLEAVRNLEHHYDAVVSGRSLPGPGTMGPSLPAEEMPDADALAADVERFLREMGG